MNRNILAANELDLALKRLTEKAVMDGIRRNTIMRLFVDHAFNALGSRPGGPPTPDGARENAALVLQEAMRLHSIYDDPGKAA